MKVYVVVFHDYEAEPILGVFLNEASARQATKARGDDTLDRLRAEKSAEEVPEGVDFNEWQDACHWASADVHEWEVEP